MALSITSITRENGAACDHVSVVVSHEGVNRTFKSSFGEIDTLMDRMAPLEQLRMLCLLWAKYRRAEGRAFLGVTIA
jgi:predicted sulfurtransferase